jgi:hypothetical protein
LEVLLTENDAVMGRVIPETRQGTIERGDHVSTDHP